MKFIGISAILSVLSLAAISQDDIWRQGEIEKVIVQDKRHVKQSASSRTVIDSAALVGSVNLSFAELLSKHSPIFVKTYGGGSMATVSFRGTAASHTAVEWNGLTINNPMLGQVDFSMIPVWMIDKTELLHGGSSLQEGAGALGGSVIVGSTPRWDKPIYGSLMQGVGSFGNYQTSALVGGGSSKFQARLRYMYQQARNDFEFKNTAIPPFDYQRQSNADYRKHSTVADLFWNVGKRNMVSLNAWFHTADRNLPTIMSYEGPGREEWQHDNELRVVGQWTYYGRNIRSYFTTGYSHTALDYYLANQTDMGQIVNYDSRSAVNSFQAKYRLEWQKSEKTLYRLSFDGVFNDVGTLDHRTDEGYTATRLDFGFTLSAHHRFSPRMAGFALLRVQNTGQIMPSVGFEWEAVSDLRLKINATRNYHQPTLNDLHWLPGGNPDLRSESGYAADLGVEYNLSKHFSISATGYLSWIDDWIIWRPGEFRYWTATNIKKVFARGLELNMTSALNLGPVRLSLRANYAYTRTTNEEPDLEDDMSHGKQLIYIPVHKANLMMDAAWKGFYLNYTWSLTSERFTNSSNASTRHILPLYDLHNITIGKGLGRFDIQFKVDNLANVDYQAILWRAMPRRNYTLLVRFNF